MDLAHQLAMPWVPLQPKPYPHRPSNIGPANRNSSLKLSFPCNPLPTTPRRVLDREFSCCSNHRRRHLNPSALPALFLSFFLFALVFDSLFPPFLFDFYSPFSFFLSLWGSVLLLAPVLVGWGGAGQRGVDCCRVAASNVMGPPNRLIDTVVHAVGGAVVGPQENLFPSVEATQSGGQLDACHEEASSDADSTGRRHPSRDRTRIRILVRQRSWKLNAIARPVSRV
jgi:hypothetical protein